MFDAAICRYWSIAGLDGKLTRELFSSVNSLLRKGRLLVFDTENTDGVKEHLIEVPFIDAFFQKNNVAVLRVNFNIK